MKSMKPQEPLIRVVDDEEEVRDSLKFMLECEAGSSLLMRPALIFSKILIAPDRAAFS